MPDNYNGTDPNRLLEGTMLMEARCAECETLLVLVAKLESGRLLLLCHQCKVFLDLPDVVAEMHAYCMRWRRQQSR